MERRSFLKTGMASIGTLGLMSMLQAGEGSPEQEWQPFSDRKLRVGLVGYGLCHFSAEFDFQFHPNVEIAAVSDLFPDRCNALAKRVGCEKTYPSLEEMVKDDSIEVIFCATDAPSHAKHAILCLEHGKHVCTAVPAFMGDIDDAERLLECVKKNRGLKYAMFETSSFHEDLYAMEKLYAAGVFGKIIYSEGEYHHTLELDAPSYDSYKGWRANCAPMWYPTHASAYYVTTTHGSLTEVSARGCTRLAGDPVPNAIGNIFDAEAGLFMTNEGGMFRLARSHAQGEYKEGGRVRGQYAGFDSFNGRINGFAAGDAGTRRMEEAIKAGIQLKRPALPPGVNPGGHGGSHGQLSNNFVEAVILDRKPMVDVVDALNMTVPGYYAHLSAVKDGETLKIPQYSL